MLGDIVKTRIVNVVEKPRVYTFIRLNTVDGSVDIRLKKGDVYQEPGYNVFSTSGVELNDKVVVSGDVDTSKKGIYELVYSLVDEYGITISVSRKVTVIDLEINYSLNPTSYTRDDVVINIFVDDNLFEYMILPDNTKVYSSKYSYKVTNNGNYLFKVYGIMGMVKEKTIEVKNIDRDGPSGSCVVDHNTNGSFITISVNDVSGIKKYEYNGSYYSNEKINLNDYISSAIVTVYDKLDNSSKLNCKVLELKEELLVDKSHYTNLKNVNYVKTARLDVSNVGCNVTYGTGNVIKSMTFHELLIDDLSGIFKNICKYINKTSWINELQSAGAYVNKGDSYHAKGMAVDLNNQWSYAVNGKTYKPYSGQGTNTWYNYNKFVCEVCDGKEDCKYNVNYIIYKRYFEGNGWCWGGNWGTGAFDPMHYEIRPDNKCVNARKQNIKCN